MREITLKVRIEEDAETKCRTLHNQNCTQCPCLQCGDNLVLDWLRQQLVVALADDAPTSCDDGES